jgi:hypothetical protein
MRTEDVSRLRVKDPATLRHGAGALVADVAARGILEPLLIRVCACGKRWLANGNHRLAAAEALGLEDVPVREEARRCRGHRTT